MNQKLCPGVSNNNYTEVFRIPKNHMKKLDFL